MQMRQRDEAKRSKAWVIVMLASSAIILLLIAFFITNSVTGNPLKGEWLAEDKGYHLDVEEDEITVEATIEGSYVEVDLYYTLNKEDSFWKNNISKEKQRHTERKKQIVFVKPKRNVRYTLKRDSEGNALGLVEIKPTRKGKR